MAWLGSRRPRGELLMSAAAPSMTHRHAALAQMWLSFAFLLGFFVCAYQEGMGHFKENVTNNLREVLMLMMSFWFMRQRETSPTPAPNPTTPPPAAKSA